MAEDIEVPTWLKVSGLEIDARRGAAGRRSVPLLPLLPAVLVGAKVRLKVGTLKAGAAKSVVTLRLTAPGMRSDQMLTSPAASRLTLLVAVVPVPPVPPAASAEGVR